MADSDDAVGSEALTTSIGPFHELESLGRGGMGEVFRAFDERLGRAVAIKVIRQDRFIDKSSVTRFITEAETAARLDHPNIVPIYEAIELGRRHFIVMKLIDGRPLSEMAEDCLKDCRRAAQIVAAVARAIHFAHQRQVLHRDLKPSNILLDSSGKAFVSDFGLAKRLDMDAQLTQTGAIVGTPGYMSPEQAVGKEDDVTSATDVYGLGGILYFAFTGRAPFEGKQPLEILRGVIDTEPTPPSKWNRHVDRDVDTICLKCLSKDPRRRYGSAEALADDLERWLRGEPILARPLSWPQRVFRWCRRQPLAASLAGVAALLAIALAIGSPLAAISIHRQAMETKRNLFASQIALARAERRGERPDHRRVGLEAVRGALDVATGFATSPTQQLAARNEAIAALAFPDVRHERTWLIPSPYPTFDSSLSHFAYSTPANEIVVRRTEDGAEVARCQASVEANQFVHLSPSCRYVAAIGNHRNARGVSIYSVATGELLWFRAIDSHNPNVQFSPAGDLIAIGTNNRNLQVFKATSGELVASIAHGGTKYIDYEWHPDGKSIAIADGTTTVRAFDVETAEVRAVFELPEETRTLVWRPDGKMIAAIAWDDIHLYDVENHHVVRTFREHRPEPVVGASYSSDGRLVASVTHSRVTHVWSADTGQLLARIHGRFPKFSNEAGRLAVVGSQGGSHATQLWLMAPPAELQFIRIEGARQEDLNTIATSYDGTRLAATGGNDLRIWELPSMKLLEQVSLPRAFGLVALPAPGKWLVNCLEGTLVVATNSSPEQSVQRTALNENREDARYFQLAASRDGTRIAAVMGPGRLQLLDRASGTQRLLETGHDEAPVAVSPDGNLVISAIDRRTLYEIVARDFTTGKRIGKIGECGRGYVKFCFSPDGRRLMAGCGVHYRCWECDAAGDWRLLYTVPRSELGIWGACAFSPDGKTFAAVDTQQLIKLRDSATGDELCSLRSPAPQPDIADLAFARDGRTLFVAGANHLLQAWDLALLRHRLAAMHLDW